MRHTYYKCVVCACQDFKILGINQYFFVSTLECLACGFRQTEWVSLEAVKYYYQNHYRGTMTSEAVEYYQKEYIQTAKYQFPLIQEYVSEASNALDYGGATGELADSLRLISKNVHVSEYDQNYLPVLRKKNYQIVSDDDLLANNVKYDLITCSHVMEHFQNPYELLNLFKKITHEGSYVYIEVPSDYAGVENNAYAKGHLTFFDIPSLRKFLEKQKNFDLMKTYDLDIIGTKCRYIGIILKRNNCDENTEMVEQDLQKLAALYSAKLVYAVHALKAHQQAMTENGVKLDAINFPFSVPMTF